MNGGTRLGLVVPLALLTGLSTSAMAQHTAHRGIQVGGNADLSVAPGYGLPLYVRIGDLADGEYEARVNTCACNETCDVLRTQRIYAVGKQVTPTQIWREVEPAYAFRARLVEGQCVDPQTGITIPDWVTQACGTDCSKHEEGKDAERFDFSVAVHSVGLDGKVNPQARYCAGTYGWRNGTAGQWVVAARRDRLAQSPESDWPPGFVRTNSIVVPTAGTPSHALHVVTGGLEKGSEYTVAIKADSLQGLDVGDLITKEALARVHKLTRRPIRLGPGRALRTAQILHPRRLSRSVGRTFDLVLLKKVDKDHYEVKAVDNPSTPGFTIQQPVPATKPDKDLLQKAITYKTEFGIGETISVGVNPPYAVQCRGQTAHIHILQSGCVLTDNSSLTESECKTLKKLEVPIQPGCRNVNTHKVAESAQLGVGSFCTVVDIDQDGRYDRGLDVADGCVQDDESEGFTIVEAPPEPVEPTVCEQFMLLREHVLSEVNALKPRAKRHVRFEEDWDHCKHFSWTLDVDHPPDTQPKPGDPDIQTVAVGKRILNVAKLVLSIVELHDIRLDLLVVGKADAISVSPFTRYDGPPSIELEEETVEAEPGDPLTNKLLAALRAWRLSQALHEETSFQGLQSRNRTKTTLRIEYEPEDETGRRGAHYRGGRIKLKVILNSEVPGTS